MRNSVPNISKSYKALLENKLNTLHDDVKQIALTMADFKKELLTTIKIVPKRATTLISSIKTLHKIERDLFQEMRKIAQELHRISKPVQQMKEPETKINQALDETVAINSLFGVIPDESPTIEVKAPSKTNTLPISSETRAPTATKPAINLEDTNVMPNDSPTIDVIIRDKDRMIPINGNPQLIRDQIQYDLGTIASITNSEIIETAYKAIIEMIATLPDKTLPSHIGYTISKKKTLPSTLEIYFLEEKNGEQTRRRDLPTQTIALDTSPKTVTFNPRSKEEALSKILARPPEGYFSFIPTHTPTEEDETEVSIMDESTFTTTVLEYIKTSILTTIRSRPYTALNTEQRNIQETGNIEIQMLAIWENTIRTLYKQRSSRLIGFQVIMNPNLRPSFHCFYLDQEGKLEQKEFKERH